MTTQTQRSLDADSKNVERIAQDLHRVVSTEPDGAIAVAALSETLGLTIAVTALAQGKNPTDFLGPVAEHVKANALIRYVELLTKLAKTTPEERADMTARLKTGQHPFDVAADMNREAREREARAGHPSSAK